MSSHYTRLLPWIYLFLSFLIAMAAFVGLIFTGLWLWNPGALVSLKKASYFGSANTAPVQPEQYVKATKQMMTIVSEEMLAVFVLSFLTLLIGLFGIAASMSGSVKFYGGVLILTCGVTLGAVVLLGLNWGRPSNMHKKVQNFIGNSINVYKQDNGTDDLSIGLDAIMIDYGCCGSHGYGDFGNWQALTQNQIPLACCKFEAGVPIGSCPNPPDLAATNANIGCSQMIFEKMAHDVAIFGYSFLFLLFLEVLLIVISAYFLKVGRKDSTSLETYDF